MENSAPVDVILIKDGDNFYLRPLGDQPVVRIAFIDIADNNPEGKGRIRAVAPGNPSIEEMDQFLARAVEDVEGYIASGAFDRDRSITAADLATQQGAQ